MNLSFAKMPGVQQHMDERSNEESKGEFQGFDYQWRTSADATPGHCYSCRVYVYEGRRCVRRYS